VWALRNPGEVMTTAPTARESLESHFMAFAAEEARLKGTVLSMNEFRQAHW